MLLLITAVFGFFPVVVNFSQMPRDFFLYRDNFFYCRENFFLVVRIVLLL